MIFIQMVRGFIIFVFMLDHLSIMRIAVLIVVENVQVMIVPVNSIRFGEDWIGEAYL